MFNKKNLLYYSSNAELGRPEVEDENDFLGELHTATSVIAKVEDDDGAEEIVRRVNMHDELIGTLKMLIDSATGRSWNTSLKEAVIKASRILKQAEQK